MNPLPAHPLSYEPNASLYRSFPKAFAIISIMYAALRASVDALHLRDSVAYPNDPFHDFTSTLVLCTRSLTAIAAATLFISSWSMLFGFSRNRIIAAAAAILATLMLVNTTIEHWEIRRNLRYFYNNGGYRQLIVVERAMRDLENIAPPALICLVAWTRRKV